jgi:hypothetical protein
MYVRPRRCCFRRLARARDLLAYMALSLGPGLLAFLREVPRGRGDVTGVGLAFPWLDPPPNIPFYDSFPFP